jgi:hypothetical protein
MPFGRPTSLGPPTAGSVASGRGAASPPVTVARSSHAWRRRSWPQGPADRRRRARPARAPGRAGEDRGGRHLRIGPARPPPRRLRHGPAAGADGAGTRDLRDRRSRRRQGLGSRGQRARGREPLPALPCRYCRAEPQPRSWRRTSAPSRSRSWCGPAQARSTSRKTRWASTIGRRLIDVKPRLTETVPFDQAPRTFDLASGRSRAMKVQLSL